jgi:hypothetical protein
MLGEQYKSEDNIYNKQQVIESVISNLGEDAKEIMRKELTSADKDKFNEMVAKAGFNSLGKYWTVSNVSKMYQLPEKSLEQEWLDLPLTNKGIYKYDYHRTLVDGENAYDRYVNTFGEENVKLLETPYDIKYRSKIIITKPIAKTDIALKVIAREDNSIENMKELAKAPVEFKADNLLDNFDTYFPDLEHLATEEKIALMKSLENGDIEIACSF